jgi:ribonuclease P protein subunit POP4
MIFLGLVLMPLIGRNFEINASNILKHELVGLDVKIVKSTEKSRENVFGKVVLETMKTIVIRTNDGKNESEKIVPKEECEFEFDLNGEKIIIDGKKILKRPEERIGK